MNSEEFRKSAQQNIPNKPGIYKFVDKSEETLYIGKAKSLRKRVNSYFTKKHQSARLNLLVKKTAKIDCTIVTSEQDALLLENNLIKELQPRYNINLKDDKTYPYICIKNERFPRIFPTRNKVDDGSTYLGPYTSMNMVRSLIDFIKDTYQVRSCAYNLSEENISKKKFKVCLEYHIGRCKGPCEALQPSQNYEEQIEQIKQILKGNIIKVINGLNQKMQHYAENYEFELAQELKERIKLLQKFQYKSAVVNPKLKDLDVFSIVNSSRKAYVNYMKVANGTIISDINTEIIKKLDEKPEEILIHAILQLRKKFNSTAPEIVVPLNLGTDLVNTKILVPKIGDKKQLLELSEKNAHLYKESKQIPVKKNKTEIRVLEQLKKDFNLAELPYHIECFDNSNIQGSTPVASVVVFRNARPSKKDYRHFNIKTVQGPDDFASMSEIVFRRYKRLTDEKQPLPQLIIIDGGKGQLNAALHSLEKLGLIGKVAIAGIAKKLEEIYFPGDPLPLHINKRSESLKLIQQIRNEAHRFAITFHRQKRNKNTLRSELTDVEGIGKKTASELLTNFKSIKKIKSATLEELTAVVGSNRAKNVFEYFRKQGK